LTFTNPIFESVKVTLATAATTPGRFASKVTILCPQFDIDANTDVWDEALKDGGASDQRRRRRDDAQGQGGHQAEAGKIWERGRNWVSIVVEVIPASLRLDTLKLINPEAALDTSPLRDDEDILEIPMFVRVEWEVDAVGDDVGATPAPSGAKDKEAKEKRELAYWSVLGIGRISQE
jgi:dynactin-4